MDRIRAGFLLAVLAGGCVDVGDAPPAKPALADFQACGFKYSDGKAVDCAAQTAQQAHTTVDAGRRCIAQTPAGDLQLTAFANQEGHVTLHYRTHFKDAGAIGVGWAWLEQDSQVVSTQFLGGGTAFVKFPRGVSTADFKATLRIDEISSQGSLPDFATAIVDIHVTEFEQKAWSVFEYRVTDKAHYFQAMEGGGPTSRRWDGSDFWLEIAATPHEGVLDVGWPSPEFWVVANVDPGQHCRL